MTNNAVLDIGIGLVLMYLILSLMGTVLNEYVATLQKLRATTLQTAVESILDNPTLRSDFYNNGVIDGVAQATGDHASYFSGQTFALAVVGSLDVTKPVPVFADVKSAIENMADCNFRDVLLAQLTKANGDLDALRNGVATYFDSAMDRVSGIYKRKLKLISFVVGCIIVIVLNADSINVGTALWKDPSLRAQTVDSAKDFLKTHRSPATPGADQKIATPAPVPAPAATGKNAPPAPADDPAKLGDTTVNLIRQLGALDSTIRPLPIGWHLNDIPDVSGWGWVMWALSKLVGLLVTALAISLGAPFWFDMLSNFMNMRGSGVKPASTTGS